MRTLLVAVRLLLTGRWNLLRHARWLADYERKETK
jgi:hypothetical protein